MTSIGRVPKGKTIARWAAEVVERFNSYTEISPSDTGVKVFCRVPTEDVVSCGRSRPTPIRTGAKWASQGGNHPPAIELYLGKRYFAVTDDHLEGTPSELRIGDTETIRWLIKEAGPNPPMPAINGKVRRDRETNRGRVPRSGSASRCVLRAGPTTT